MELLDVILGDEELEKRGDCPLKSSGRSLDPINQPVLVKPTTLSASIQVPVRYAPT